MIREEMPEDAGARFIEKTDAQILRELYGVQGRRRTVLPDDQSGHQDGITDDETESQTHRLPDTIVKLAA